MMTGLALHPTQRRTAPWPATPGGSGPDAHLLRRLRVGDPDAYADLVAHYRPRLLAVARRLLRNEEDCADAVQDVFLALVRSVGSFAGSSGLWTWLYRVLVNGCLTRLRSRARRPAVAFSALPGASPDGLASAARAARRPEQPYEAVARAETRAQIRACIDRLPPAARRVLWLRDIEELDTDEAAEALGMSPGAVRTSLHRARRALRELLRPGVGPEVLDR